MLNVSLFRFCQEKMLNNFVEEKDTFFTFLVQNWPFFRQLFLANIGQENVFHDILERKNAFLGYKNNKFKKSKNWDFCKGANPWFWSKTGQFSIFFLGILGQENVFYDILERENAFLGYKNSKFKKWKNWDFCKGVNPWFCSKIGHFSIFLFLSIIAQENVFYDILDRKNALLGYKNNKFKLPFFHLFFLGNIGQETVFYDILEREKTSLGYKSKTFKKSKNWDFCEGVNPWFWCKIDHFSVSCF